MIFAHIHMAGPSHPPSRTAMPGAPLGSSHWGVLALTHALAMPGTKRDRTGQKLRQGACKELHDCESVPWSCFIYYNRHTGPLLLLSAVLKLPSHPEAGCLKPWGYLHVGCIKPWGYLHECCGSIAGCSGGTQRPPIFDLQGQDPVLHPQPSPCPPRRTVQSSPRCVALHCIPCPSVPFYCQDCLWHYFTSLRLCEPVAEKKSSRDTA